MELKELERRAAAGEALPKQLSMEEAMLFLALRSLYHDYAAGFIERGKAAAEKQHVMRAYLNAKDTTAQRAYADGYHRIIASATQEALRRYRLDRTLANADRLVDTMDGISNDIIKPAPQFGNR